MCVSSVPTRVRGFRYPGAGVTGTCELPGGTLEARPGPLQEHLRGLS